MLRKCRLILQFGSFLQGTRITRAAHVPKTKHQHRWVYYLTQSWHTVKVLKSVKAITIAIIMTTKIYSIRSDTNELIKLQSNTEKKVRNFISTLDFFTSGWITWVAAQHIWFYWQKLTQGQVTSKLISLFWKRKPKKQHTVKTTFLLALIGLRFSITRKHIGLLSNTKFLLLP